MDMSTDHLGDSSGQEIPNKNSPIVTTDCQQGPTFIESTGDCERDAVKSAIEFLKITCFLFTFLSHFVFDFIVCIFIIFLVLFCIMLYLLLDNSVQMILQKTTKLVNKPKCF